MRLTDIQVAGLKALADACPTPPGCLRMAPEVQAAFTLGQVLGQANLARELLQEAAHRQGVDCDLTGAARR